MGSHHAKPKASISPKSSGFEKNAAIDGAFSKKQEPVNSKAYTSGAVKKTPVKKEDQTRERVQSSATQYYRRNDQSILSHNESRRKLKRELISSDFKRVDAHAISAGQKLKSKRIFSAQTIAKAITTGTSTDLERLRAIWTWICHNIDYDVSGYLGLTEKVYSPEQVIKTGRGVCAGYSSVCLQLCREVGIECREVSGHGKGEGYKLGQSYQNTESNHRWNAVRLEDHWYLLDACWGAGVVNMDNKSFTQRYNEFYFLTDPEEFVSSHLPKEEEWQLLDKPIKLEEFEKSVFKTSEFYKFGLTLIHPKQYLLVTENGEASISIRLSQTVDFMYTIYQHQNGEQKELSKSMGFLTVSQNIMKLVLIPSMSGTFEIKLFAKIIPTPANFNWVCSFLLECDKPKTTENFPENPYRYWGIQQNAKDLGLKPCLYGHKDILLKSGSSELVLHTNRPLTMLCEISHKDLDATLAKRCLATQIEADKLTCIILCPYIGYYRLSVFVKDYENDSQSFQNVGNFLLHCTANPVNLNQLFPSDLSTFCGPGTRTDSAGLSKFSHTGAIVSTQQGMFNITFQNQHDLDLYAVLKQSEEQSGHPLSQHVFFTYDGSKVTLSLTLPEPGVYKLSLFGKTPSTQNFKLLCDLILQNNSESPEFYKPRTIENLPENPYRYWGIKQNAKDLGLRPCIYGHEGILLKSGSSELVLHTNRPLTMLCEISHKDLDATLAKRCLATQIEADKLTCIILCPYIGYYRLSVFVKDYENDSQSFQNVGNFLLHCTANPVNLNQLFPPDLSQFCGPGTRTDSAGLSKFSHTGAIVSTQQEMINITFQNQHDLELHAVLKHSKEQSGHALSRHVFFTYNGSKVTLSLTLPEPGVYKLSLFGKTPSTQEFNLLCDFILQNNSESPGLPFPYTYTAWRKGSVLYEPRSGLLEPLCCVKFRVLVPGVHKVMVLGERTVDLTINKSHIWEGEVFTGNVRQIKLATSQDETSNKMDIVMIFDVLRSQNGMLKKKSALRGKSLI